MYMSELARAFKKPENTKLLLRKIIPGVLSEKGRVRVVLANGESYSIDASRIRSISYIPGRGYVIDYETEHPEFYGEKGSIADPNDPMLKLAIPLRFKIEKSIETAYLCPFCGRELELEKDADDIAYRCETHGYEWEWDEYVDIDVIPRKAPKPIRKEIEKTKLEIDPPNIRDVENFVAKFADIEARWINNIPGELVSLISKDSKEYSADFYTSITFPAGNHTINLAMKEINNEKYLLAEITKNIYHVVHEEMLAERALFKVKIRDHELFSLLFGKIEETEEPEISFDEAVKIAREKIPDWADGIVFVGYESCGGYLDQYHCGYLSKALPAKASRKPGSFFYTSVRWRSIDLGEHSYEIFKHLTNKLVTKDDIYEIEPVGSSFDRKDYYDLKLKNMEDILKKRKIEKFDDLVSEIDRILPEWSKGIYISRENDRYVVRMVAEYPSRDYDYYYKENWVVNLDVPEDLLKQLDGKVILRSGKIVEVERAGKRPSDKIKLNKKG